MLLLYIGGGSLLLGAFLIANAACLETIRRRFSAVHQPLICGNELLMNIIFIGGWLSWVVGVILPFFYLWWVGLIAIVVGLICISVITGIVQLFYGL